MEHINLAYSAWSAGNELRSKRERYKNFTYGRQWGDPVTIHDGRVVSEEEAARIGGARPLSNNMIRQLVKCIVGNFRASLADAASDASKISGMLPQEMARRNCVAELDCRMLEEFLISGCAVQRVVTEHRTGGTGVWIDNVSPARFFVNPFTDPRGSDIELVGMLHDYSLRETVMRFAPDDAALARRIEAAYLPGRESGEGITVRSAHSEFFSAPSGRCRVVEMWTLESRGMLKVHDPRSGRVFMIPESEAPAVGRVNAVRSSTGLPPLETVRRITARWHCRFMTPQGMVLDEFDSPYAHGLHPFAVKFYPLTDGEVHSFVEDVVDQQRYVNRLITLIDHVISTSAKGALLFPVDSRPEDVSWNSIRELWARPGAVIPVRGSASGQMPHAITSSTEPSGAYRLLDVELQLLQQVSGVNNALQGRLDSTSTGAALYESQVRNSSVAILDITETFNQFRSRRNYLALNC